MKFTVALLTLVAAGLTSASTLKPRHHHQEEKDCGPCNAQGWKWCASPDPVRCHYEGEMGTDYGMKMSRDEDHPEHWARDEQNGPKNGIQARHEHEGPMQDYDGDHTRRHHPQGDNNMPSPLNGDCGACLETGYFWCSSGKHSCVYGEMHAY